MDLLRSMMIDNVHVMINRKNDSGFIETSKSPKGSVDVSTIVKE